MRRRGRKGLFIGFGALLIFASGLSIMLIRNKGTGQIIDVLSVNSFNSEEHGLTLSYFSDSVLDNLTDADKNSGIFMRIKKSNAPQYLITARAETGLRLPSQLARQDVIDIVVNGATKANPDRYPGYALESEEDRDIAGKPAHHFIFSYDGPTGERAKQSLYLIATTPDKAIYISMQAKESDFDALNATVFSPLINSIEF